MVTAISGNHRMEIIMCGKSKMDWQNLSNFATMETEYSNKGPFAYFWIKQQESTAKSQIKQAID